MDGALLAAGRFDLSAMTAPKFTVNNEKAVRALQWHMKQFAAQGGWPAIKAFHEGTNFNQAVWQRDHDACLYATNASRPTINTFEGLKWVFCQLWLAPGWRRIGHVHRRLGALPAERQRES